MKRSWILGGISLLLVGCSQAGPAASPTPLPTANLEPTPTIAPTSTTAPTTTSPPAPTGVSEASSDNNPVASSVVTTPSGLRYEDLELGTGEQPSAGVIAVVHYTGWLEDGTKFDSSVDLGTPFEFPLGQGRVIKGWDEGVATMKVGGRRRLTIPAELAYGSRGFPGAIPPNSTLIFEIELLGLR